MRLLSYCGRFCGYYSGCLSGSSDGCLHVLPQHAFVELLWQVLWRPQLMSVWCRDELALLWGTALDMCVGPVTSVVGLLLHGLECDVSGWLRLVSFEFIQYPISLWMNGRHPQSRRLLLRATQITVA